MVPRELAKHPLDEQTILFFFDKENLSQPYHSMIVTEVEDKNVTLLYHTGSKAGIKRIDAAYLNRYRKFTPQKWNENFMGVFRFHIIA